jgi:hypothetical protein
VLCGDALSSTLAHQTYLRVQLGINVLDGARHDEAADHFTAAVNSTAFSSKSIHQTYEDLMTVCQDDTYISLFVIEYFGHCSAGISSPCCSRHQKRCQAFLSAGKTDDALEAHKYMMDAIDEPGKDGWLEWSNGKFSVTSPAAIILTCISLRIQGTMQRVSCAR